MRIEKDRVVFEPLLDTKNDLERIARLGVGPIIHTPSDEEVANFGGRDVWFTPYALPKMPTTSGHFLFRNKEDSMRHSELPSRANNSGLVYFKYFEELMEFLEGGAFGLIRLVDNKGDTLRKQYSTDLLFGKDPKTVLLTPYRTVPFVGFPDSLYIKQAIKEGKPIFYTKREKLLDDVVKTLWRDWKERESIFKTYVSGASLPIGEGNDISPEASSFHSTQNRMNIGGISIHVFSDATNTLEPVIDGAGKDLKDERLADIVYRVATEAYLRGLSVTPVAAKNGSKIYYAYIGVTKSSATSPSTIQKPAPLDIYRFMALRGDDFGRVVDLLFTDAIIQSARFSYVAKKVITEIDKDYLIKKHGFLGDSDYETEVSQRYKEDKEFSRDYRASIGDLKRALMPKFGGVVTDRYTKNFIVGGFFEENGTLKQYGDPRVWIVDPDKLQVDLLQRDIIKLIYTPTNNFSPEQLSRYLDLGFTQMGFKSDDKPDYYRGLAIASFERNHSWARKLAESAAKATTIEESRQLVEEAIYHYTTAVNAGTQIAQMLEGMPESSTAFARVAKKLEQGLYQTLHLKIQ